MPIVIPATGVNEQVLHVLFNPEWYLKHYPDVAAAGIDPWRHFVHHGMHEHRLPCPVTALELENKLWRGHTEVLPKLHTLAQGKGTEAAVAAWVLARWYASLGEHALAEPLLRAFFAEPVAGLLVNHAGPWLLLFAVLWHQGKIQQANAWLEQPGWPELPDHALARFMLPAHHTLATLNAFYQEQGLCPLALLRAESTLSLDNLAAPSVPAARRSWWQRQPLVSVILPCYNAEATIATALRSLQQQSWQNLEILVVDDASTDGSAQTVAALARQDPRITLLRHNSNQGTYAARNTALAKARGRFITTHDSDDWSHPQKIERQAKALMKSPKVQACLSHLIRCSPELHFKRWRMEDSWVTKNLSSLMFRKKVRKALGYWDSVSVGADSEFYQRLLKRFGNNGLVEIMPGIPLTLSRVNDSSLTQHNQTHLRTHYLDNGLRRRYYEAALAWHQKAQRLYMPASPVRRPFAAPAPMCRGTADARNHNLELLAIQHGLFSPDWYLRRYPDVAAAGMDPWQHYFRFGYREGRDPGPAFSGSGYRYATPESQDGNPLVHLLNTDKAGDYSLPHHVGQRPWQPDAPTLLLCAHQVSEHTYGAERSLLDVLRALSTLPCNLVVTLPSAQNTGYADQILALSHRLVVVPYRWWQAGRDEDTETLAHFEQLIRHYEVSLIYCNTLTLLEPYVAARNSKVPTITHVRELPEHDAALCQVLNANPAHIRQHLLAHSDFFIANSTLVAGYLNQPERVEVIGNVIDAHGVAPTLPGRERLQVGMISSNLPKKGLHDFVALATLLHQGGIAADCLLIGPDNEHTQALRTQSSLPANLELTGYIPSSYDAIAKLDVVVNLSHVQESFGRTVLEAMAAGRPVICYDWGALPELVKHGETGFLVPLGAITEATTLIATLSHDNALLVTMGKAAQSRATQHYSPMNLQHALSRLLHRLLGHAKQ
ncbi:hypothetical protein GCM10011502_26160 [Oceanisphaera marina]|uniref:Glycosyltransferase n=1 Tax=Oceanisphaera marina TaxID=2017550 RepID=A0ABQ1IUT7_9GAMM|nr:glycosyltransferase [Oceanisphaera marina]GGB51779.1 hypothetical protein GCM10011502_26160 [Oceanisphaera marina]